MSLEVCGLGNALMDVLVHLENDDVLEELGLRKGIMHLVDHEAWLRAYDAVRGQNAEIYPGGSCANTLSSIALLGGKALLCGQVAEDEFGKPYAKALEDICGEHRLHILGADQGETGKCLSLISKDGERTMLTNLGCSTELTEAFLFQDALAHCKVLHLTGYQFTGGEMVNTAKKALEIAKANGVKISFDVADPFVVRFNRELIWDIIKGYADIVFTNEEEARSLCELAPEEAAHELAQHVDIAIVKLGSKGSMIQRGSDVVNVAVHKVEAVDTTGAGDAYAGGFLYGFLRGFTLQRCGNLASRIAAETVAQTGAVLRDKKTLAEVAAHV